MARHDRTGYDIAWVAVLTIGGFLASVNLILGADLILNSGTGLSANGQLVLVSGLGAISTIAGGAMGYWTGTHDRTNDPTRPPPPAPDPGEDE